MSANIKGTFSLSCSLSLECERGLNLQLFCKSAFGGLHNKHASRLHNNLSSYSIQCDRKKREKKAQRLALDLDGTLYRITMCAFNDFQIQQWKRKIQISFTFRVQFYFVCFIPTSVTMFFSGMIWFSIFFMLTGTDSECIQIGR